MTPFVATLVNGVWVDIAVRRLVWLGHFHILPVLGGLEVIDILRF